MEQKEVMESSTKVAVLTNRKWFSVVCALIDNDIRHHGGQNVVDSQGAAERVIKITINITSGLPSAKHQRKGIFSHISVLPLHLYILVVIRF